MISELKDDEILEFLLTSDLEENYSPTELKYLILKYRYFYRLLHGSGERTKVEFLGEIQKLKESISTLEKDKLNLQVQSANKQNQIDSLKSRPLTWKERISGKIIHTENENK